MINTSEILQTVRMITEEKLDIRTITMGISLFSCCTRAKASGRRVRCASGQCCQSRPLFSAFRTMYRA